MTSMIRYQTPVERAFDQYKNVTVTELNAENGKVSTKKLGNDDKTIEAEEYKYALTDMYSKLYKTYPNEVYERWIQQCGTINEPIKDAKTFGEMVLKAFEQLTNIAKDK